MFKNILEQISCPYCDEQFKDIKKAVFGNHIKWCKKNPNTIKWRAILKKSITDANIRKFGSFKLFSVCCQTCKSNFNVTEREKQFPKHKQYFCSRSCANSVGGTRKSEKYGSIGKGYYRNRSKKWHGTKCICCGFDKFIEVHHIDGNRENNIRTNIVPLCPNCHTLIHKPKFRQEILKKVINYIDGPVA